MHIVLFIGVLILSYIIGSIPFGLVIVRLKTGKDIRKIESGRTGGTNAMRAAGFWAGAATTILDFLKAACAVWIARLVLPGNLWLEVLAPVAAVIGHNYSIFLPDRDENGRFRLRGGAGGASSAGGAFGLWWPISFITIPVGLFILFVVGYASVATMSVAITAAIIFALRAWSGADPWQYIFYGVLTEIVLIWVLRPNIRRLIQGNERIVGLRAWRRKKAAKKEDQTSNSDQHSSSSATAS